MRFFGVINVAAGLLVACAAALPSFGFGAGNGCLTKYTAYELVQNFIELSNGDEFNVTLAKELLTEDVVDTSGSVASVINAGALRCCTVVSKRGWLTLTFVFTEQALLDPCHYSGQRWVTEASSSPPILHRHLHRMSRSTSTGPATS